MAHTPNSADSRRSRYTQGGTTTRHQTRLGWWERVVYDKKIDDVVIIIQPQHSHRPDLLAAEIYGDSKLMWVILQFNNIVDIVEEFTEGTEITVPSPERVSFGMLNNSIGGIPPIQH